MKSHLVYQATFAWFKRCRNKSNKEIKKTKESKKKQGRSKESKQRSKQAEKQEKEGKKKKKRYNKKQKNHKTYSKPAWKKNIVYFLHLSELCFSKCIAHILCLKQI